MQKVNSIFNPVIPPEGVNFNPTTNIFTNIFNNAKTTDEGTPNYNSINYTLTNTLTTNITKIEEEDPAEIKIKRKKKQLKGRQKVAAEFFGDL